jgi:hypothetical protein
LASSTSKTVVEFTRNTGAPVLVNLRLVRHATQVKPGSTPRQPGGTRITFDNTDTIIIKEEFSAFRDLMMAALDTE